MTASDYEWQPDILGKDFQQLVIPLGADPISEGGEGDIFATLVRYAPADQPTPTSRPAVLFVHGMTDYFFQRHVAQWFHQHGFSVYALDLRKCGRSHRNNQSWHYISDISRYFEELDRAKSHHRRAPPNNISYRTLNRRINSCPLVRWPSPMRDFASYDSRRDTQQPVAGHDDSGNGHPSIEAHIDSRRTTFSPCFFWAFKRRYLWAILTR
ncbi:hypothetical protein FRC0456_01454 [Corynebacterium diphtheriae]|nr:hypothetical protein FRC0084_01441 [Corynebacterium diphtheriae]CAB0847565.1 hypothetical protein FRC0322_01326 [Corynebacterium diphtheriae]CAB0850850.1 hypothetical protein FRC0332_01482 [Corynebacterium diphtheriae]CAB0868175.1 hypothetical protein FRC0356_01524 [Corynebacterium diphtheriae]CAB0958736.1 hypothetical protein FRC0469_01450 [Corynebacterium diphtheriae]